MYTNLLAFILLPLMVKSDYTNSSELCNYPESDEEAPPARDCKAEMAQYIDAINYYKRKLKKLQSKIAHLQSGATLESEIKEKDHQLSLNAEKIKQLEAQLSKPQESKYSSCLHKPTDVHLVAVPVRFHVPCNADLAGPGWTVIQRRMDGSENFYRNWTDYRTGFGDVNGEYFIGLDRLHLILHLQPHELYVYLKDAEDQTRYAQYSHFMIGNEADLYELKSIGHYSGTAGDSLKVDVGMKFSTPDRENGPWKTCATQYKAGWWYHKCGLSNLNGQYNGKRPKGVEWVTWNTKSLKFAQMMIRPTASVRSG